MTKKQALIPAERIEKLIILVRHQKVMLDRDLATPLVDALRRDGRVEAEGAPADGDVDSRDEIDGAGKSALAEIAPRTDDVGNDVNCDRFGLHGPQHRLPAADCEPDGLATRLPPPRLQLIAEQRRLFGMLDSGPARDPLVGQVEKRHDVVAGDEHTIERPHA